QAWPWRTDGKKPKRRKQCNPFDLRFSALADWAISPVISAAGGTLASNTHMSVDDEKERLNSLSNCVIGAALRVHNELGPGMLESAYEACLMYELVDQGLNVERQKPVPVVYRGRRLDCATRIDLLL